MKPEYNTTLGVLPDFQSTQNVVNYATSQQSIPWWQKLTNIANPLLDVSNKVIDTVQNVKSGSGSTTQTQLQQQQQLLNQQQQKSNVLKYVLIAAGLLVGGTVAYQFASRGKKKKALSGPEETIDVPHTDLGSVKSAKKKSSVAKHRKAVKKVAKKLHAKKVRL